MPLQLAVDGHCLLAPLPVPRGVVQLAGRMIAALRLPEPGNPQLFCANLRGKRALAAPDPHATGGSSDGRHQRQRRHQTTGQVARAPGESGDG